MTNQNSDIVYHGEIKGAKEDSQCEIWIPISGYEDLYSVSNYARIKSNKIIMKTSLSGRYEGVTLSNGKEKFFNVHRLVAKAFIPNPLNKPFVNHINGDRKDNRVKNLEWVTESENTIHAFKTGLMKGQIGEINPRVKLTEKKVREIRFIHKTGILSVKEFCSIYKVKKSTIGAIVSYTNWKHIS